jgi:nucleoside-diphosphate-sugar epimerase
MDNSNKLFCFGYGYTCDYLGYDLLNKGWSVAGTTRDLDKRESMKQNGVKAYVFDYRKPLADPSYFFNNVTHLLISTPPSDDGDPVYLVHADDILSIPTLKWVGYLSSTAVYGNRGGEWVDESTELRPTSIRGSRREKAEQQWLSLFTKNNLPVHIFRLAGIYGPQRSALDSVRAGVARRINKPGHVFSRIHITDIVNVLEASMSNPSPGSIYNVCDDMPAPSHEIISYACELLGIVPPPLESFDETNLAPMARSFYQDNKRVSNDRIKTELAVDLSYPDYIKGLEACLEAEKDFYKT